VINKHSSSKCDSAVLTVDVKKEKISRRKFLKLTSLFSLSGFLQSFFTFKARAGGFIPFSFIKKSTVAPLIYVDELFSIDLYTGNGASLSIVNGIDLAGKGGLVWIKCRSLVTDHELIDTQRGAGYAVRTDTASGEQNFPTSLSSFNSDGFTLGSFAQTNSSGATQVAWTFRKSARFFDVVTWTGDGSVGRTVNHSLGINPGMITIRRRDANSTDWATWHSSATGDLWINTTAAQSGSYTQITAVSSSSFTISSSANVNASGGTYVAFIFANDTSSNGIIKSGSFTSAAGSNFVSLGFEPQFLIYKNIDAAEDWGVLDIMRGIPIVGSVQRLLINGTAIETAPGVTFPVFPTGNGFGYTGYFSGPNKYIYLAIRRTNKPPTSGTQVYNAITRNGTGGSTSVTGVGFAPDLIISSARTSQNPSHYFFDRLRGPALEFYTSNTSIEKNYAPSLVSFDRDGYSAGIDNLSGGINYSGWPYIQHFFKRASGFFDTVCYNGTGADTTINHNLGVVPEMMILKNRTTAQAWNVYHSATGKSQNAQLNLSNPFAGSSSWCSTTPTSTIFKCAGIGPTETAVVYLFASLAGVSKVGSYTGSSSGTISVNCGFSGNARFVLIKRSDAAGDWIVVDSTRGSGYYLTLNTTVAEIATSVVTFTTGGFTTAAAGSITNASSSATYIFLAIA
jgi:hypothetical protein